jgi:hypothetical protein
MLVFGTRSDANKALAKNPNLVKAKKNINEISKTLSGTNPKKNKLTSEIINSVKAALNELINSENGLKATINPAGGKTSLSDSTKALSNACKEVLDYFTENKDTWSLSAEEFTAADKTEQVEGEDAPVNKAESYYTKLDSFRKQLTEFKNKFSEGDTLKKLNARDPEAEKEITSALIGETGIKPNFEKLIEASKAAKGVDREANTDQEVTQQDGTQNEDYQARYESIANDKDQVNVFFEDYFNKE